jgi:hypothetical protein
MRSIRPSLFKGIILGLVIFSICFFLSAKSYSVSANITTQPQFPSCEIKTEAGDWVHSNLGFHHIPGQEATIEGSDDVYFLEGGNFLQCLCPVSSTQGTQTNWWRVGDLSQDQINDMTSQGWFLEDGGGWNLLHEAYLAKNQGFTCQGQSVTPGITQTPTPSSEPAQGGPAGAPVCNDTVPPTPRLLTAIRQSTSSVKVTWQKVNQANNYSILYGPSTGNYLYSVFATGDIDNFMINGLSKGCFVVKAVNGCMPGPLSSEICTSGLGGVLGVSNLPETGTSSLFSILILIFVSTGIYLYRRFKLV